MQEKPSRRAFLGRVFAASAGAALLGAGVLFSALRRRPARVDEPGPLAPETLTTLGAVTETVIGLPIELDHYRDFLRWRAENLPGFRVACERFAAHVERAARPRAFAALPPPERKRIVEAALASRDPGVAEFGAIRRELLVLYSQTDAWRALGYDSWPGVPRGLVAYQTCPT